MILRIEDLKEICTKLLAALDSDGINTFTETLSLNNSNGLLTLAVTNREYIVKTMIKTFDDTNLSAAVNASTFLKLINQLSTEVVTITIDSNFLLINGDGTYKLPLIYEGEKLLVLPDIKIKNETARFSVSKENLNLIATCNSKELLKSGIVNPVQRLYYLDNKGCITFTTGACVTEFNLDKNIQVLLTPKVVKLFKMFKDDLITVVIGNDNTTSGIPQTKISFESDSVILTSKLPSDSSLLNSVPCDAIRSMATDTYDYSIVLNRKSLLNTINRLMLLNISTTGKTYGKFVVTSTNLIVSDIFNNNVESLKFENELPSITEYVMGLDFMDLKYVLESMHNEFITMNFGNHRAVVIQRPNVYNVIPECELQ